MSDATPSRVSGKRDPALVELSRDHHQALVQALRLKRAGSGDRTKVTDDFLEFWNGHGRRHFAIEEELLLPAMARYCDATDEAIVRVLTDHVEIRRRTRDLERGEDVEPSRLNELGELLDAHVRFEERVLFERIQELLPSDELASLGKTVIAAERADA